MSTQYKTAEFTLPTNLVCFIENYRTSYNCKNRSEVIELALNLFQQAQLEQHYIEANSELDNDFECVIADGLDAFS